MSQSAGVSKAIWTGNRMGSGILFGHRWPIQVGDSIVLTIHSADGPDVTGGWTTQLLPLV